MAETRAGSEKISVVLEIQGDAETRKRVCNRLLETLREIQDNGAVCGTCMIWTANGMQATEIGADQ